VSMADDGFNRIKSCEDGAMEVRHILASVEKLSMLEQHLLLLYRVL